MCTLKYLIIIEHQNENQNHYNCCATADKDKRFISINQCAITFTVDKCYTLCIRPYFLYASEKSNRLFSSIFSKLSTSCWLSQIFKTMSTSKFMKSWIDKPANHRRGSPLITLKFEKKGKKCLSYRGKTQSQYQRLDSWKL